MSEWTEIKEAATVRGQRLGINHRFSAARKRGQSARATYRTYGSIDKTYVMLMTDDQWWTYSSDSFGYKLISDLSEANSAMKNWSKKYGVTLQCFEVIDGPVDVAIPIQIVEKQLDKLALIPLDQLKNRMLKAAAIADLELIHRVDPFEAHIIEADHVLIYKANNVDTWVCVIYPNHAKVGRIKWP